MNVSGHAMLHTLYGQSLKEGVQFFIEWFALDLMMSDGKCVGITAMNMEDGTCHRMFAKNTVLATGGTLLHSLFLSLERQYNGLPDIPPTHLRTMNVFR